MKAAWVLLATAVAVALQTTMTAGSHRHASTWCWSLWCTTRFASGRYGTLHGLDGWAGAGRDVGRSHRDGRAVEDRGRLFPGIVGTQFIVAHSLPAFVVFFLATIVNAAVFMGLYELLGLRHFGTPYAAVAAQGLGNAVVGVLAFKFVEFLPGAVERGGWVAWASPMRSGVGAAGFRNRSAMHSTQSVRVFS